MARKFFNEKVNKSSNPLVLIIIIAVCVIGIIICFILASSFSKKNKGTAIIKVRDSVAIEVNTAYPDKTLYFAEIANVKEEDIKVNTKDADITKVGSYNVEVSVNKNTYKVILNVVDSKSPELLTKDLQIAENTEYKAQDFVESCTDNSGEECIIEFYSMALNEDGNPSDFANYKTKGEYDIQIIALDSSNNKTTPIKAKLTIGETPTTPTKPIECKYGDNAYDSEKFILATYITENNCAIDLNLYQDEKTLTPAENILKSETEKLKKEFQKLNINDPVTVSSQYQAVLNTTGKGIVGYTVYIEVTVNSEIVESYHVNLEGKRIYTTNKYNLE